jgi:hypothetical protein
MSNSVDLLPEVNWVRFWIKYLLSMLISMSIMISILETREWYSAIPGAEQVLCLIWIVILIVSMIGGLITFFGFRQSYIAWSGTKAAGTEIELMKSRPILGGFFTGVLCHLPVLATYHCIIYQLKT